MMSASGVFRLDGKVAVVTGGGSGIGRAIACLFARQGALVEIIDIDADGAKETVATIMQAGGQADHVVGNLADADSVRASFQTIIARRSRINIQVNNAGVAHVGNILNTSVADFERVWSVNARGVYLCLQAGSPTWWSRAGE